ncbi:hypothetical protein, partial [Brevundimonas nasdae]|uniref:hypothetical protein n=1 Tax=Brevundimonas nasdae TaxID=172043 RepID=UPI0005802355
MAPDLSDPAVERRLTMLKAGGAEVTVSGFLRGKSPPPPADWKAESLGRTRDAALGQRALMVAWRLLNPVALRRRVQSQDAVLARNLEMLVLAWCGLLLAGSRARLCYEVLDIHRVMLGDGLKSRLLRRVEATLLKRVDLLVISSKAFDRNYFERLQPLSAPRLLLENKVLSLDGEPQASQPPSPPPPEGPPWRIGWFGMLRCRRSLEILGRLAAKKPGLVQVDLRGRPSPAVFGDDFDAVVAEWPGLTYHGPYKADDLPAAYGAVHLVWAIDFYEAGQNSDWLLPNRLYEGAAHGRPLLALRHVETGRWLDEHRAGLLMNDVESELETTVDKMSMESYRLSCDAVVGLDPADLFATRRDCRDLVKALTELSR